MDNVAILRLDKLAGEAPGNKAFKLRPYLETARSDGVGRLLSFGGAWSNHLHALAASGAKYGLQTVGLVRGETHEGDTAMLADVRRWGMQVERIGRSEYRRRHDRDFQDHLRERFGPCLLIPEGGASASAAAACRSIADMIMRCAPQVELVVLPVGTGTTLAGIAAALPTRVEVLGISALKGALDLSRRVHDLLAQMAVPTPPNWRISHDYHGGGFARVSPELRAFLLEFEAAQGVLLDPVYTAKSMYAVQQMIALGEISAKRATLMVHTGGLQGRRGYDWLGGPALC